jgi:site-specific DNA recombinase
MKTPLATVAETRNVGIWIRVSTEDQAKGESPEHHLARARAYAVAKGWTVKEVYDLAGVSGKSVMEQPEAKRMLSDIRERRITGLIFSKLARLARNTRELLDFADIFRDCGADMVSLQETIDTSTPAGRLFFTMIAAMAQWEREEIADRVKASIGIRAKLGKPLNGKVAFGYHWKDSKLVPHPGEAPVRKLIYELFAEHQRKKTVARILNERGYRTRDGSKFSDTTVGRLIQDPTAKGIHRANFTRRVASDKPYALKPEHEWVYNPVEPIVAEDLWQRCNDLLEARKTKQERPGKRPVQLFAGLVLCSCGKKMYVPSNTPKYVCTACRNKIPIVDLEGVFIDELKGYLVSSERVAEYLSKANETVSEKARLVETLQKELQKVKEEADKTYRLYLDGALTVPQFKEIFQPLDTRKHQIEEEIPRAEAEMDVLNVDRLSSEQIMAEARDLHARWPNMTAEDRRKIVELLVKDIRIGKGEISLNLYYAPGFEEMSNKQRMLLCASRSPDTGPLGLRSSALGLRPSA